MSDFAQNYISEEPVRNPLVSIVIPFYNLEGTVTRCLSSVLAQTFTDFEVVCVDDGSTDKTGDLLDHYSRYDSRVRVIHQQNGGLSDARNHGVDSCRGLYVSFVDGDDVVSPTYLELLISAMDGAVDRLVIGNFKPIPEARLGNESNEWPTSAPAKLVSREKASREILVKHLPTFAQAKLFGRSYYQEHPFPVGVRYEEIRTIGKLMANVNEVSVVDAPIYGYVLREGSIVLASNATGEQGLEYIDAILTALDDFADLGYELDYELAFFKSLMFTRVHDFAKRIRDPEESRIVDDVAQAAVRESWHKAILCRSASMSQRMRVALFRANLPLYDKAMTAYNHYIKGMGAR